ncbi:hypothetical protein EVAR_101917_1 [Eumeta japonica]|uniref:Uncharacterized protein n=1 Tax=Eumeta variegata TaxID=151549 RepID=A0A4C1TSA7_EUMVA|nr:hypothetical protein EVAR_101917_1 [Eumeta japonica]
MRSKCAGLCFGGVEWRDRIFDWAIKRRPRARASAKLSVAAHPLRLVGDTLFSELTTGTECRVSSIESVTSCTGLDETEQCKVERERDDIYSTGAVRAETHEVVRKLPTAAGAVDEGALKRRAAVAVMDYELPLEGDAFNRRAIDALPP